MQLLTTKTLPVVLQHTPVSFDTALVHEVRNPLANIRLAIQVLETAVKDADQLVYLQIIKRSANRINELVADLLKSKKTGGVQIREHSMLQLLDQVLEATADQIALKNITLIKDFSPKDCKIVLNAEQVKIALTNIIVNAIDAMGLENGQLKLVAKSVGESYILLIEDNGCGISKMNLKNIFKPYFTNKPCGLGLGLASSYDILRSNHIRVNVESEEKRGTRFVLLFERNILA